MTGRGESEPSRREFDLTPSQLSKGNLFTPINRFCFHLRVSDLFRGDSD